MIAYIDASAKKNKFEYIWNIILVGLYLEYQNVLMIVEQKFRLEIYMFL